MKLFRWPAIPETVLGPHTGRFSGESALGLLRISTNEGIDGHAFLGSAYNPATNDGPSLISFLKPILLGKNPLDREWLHHALWAKARVTTTRAIGAIDVALWDIAGKAAGQPIHRLLGSYRDRIAAYATSPVYTEPALYVEEACRLKEEGWTAYKIHPPCKPDKDLAVARRVREAVGADYPLMFDALWHHQYAEALRIGMGLQDLDFLWYEDPLSDQDIGNYVELRRKLHIPIVATEQPFAGLDSYPIWLTSRATDALRGDVANKGGITTCIKTAHLAEAFRMNYEIHHGNNSLNNVANLHLAVAIRNTTRFEVLLPHRSQKYGLVQDIEVGPDGHVEAPSQPGLGYEIDFGLIEKEKISTLA
ncbi:enolase C-terminal domain-like protein [Pigmentiphaga soli]|uniref:Enolase C-terminal domain-like protein n=1 Tax=Pigmentiphaga soli TaxID=1007095 RepID=A0ABP8HHQ0_9BURK